MTDKEKILAFLEGMSKGCCPKETKEIIINKIIPWINDLSEEPVSEDLNTAAKRYATEGDEISGLYIIDEEVDAFKAGAKWQKEKDEEEKVLTYKHGFEDCKEQMMAKAVDGDITFDYYGDNDKTYGCIVHDSFCLEDFGLKDRDKVKVIVIKED